MRQYLILLFILLGIMIFLVQQSKAANDLDKWNSEQGRVARTAMKEKIASTTYRELPNHVDSTYRSTANGGKVLREIETNATVKGSRVGTTINAYKEVNKSSAAKRFAENFAKGLGKDMLKQGVRLTAGGILISAALDEMLEGIGWIIDEGGKVRQKPLSQNPADFKYYSYIESENYYFYHNGTETISTFCTRAMPAIGDVLGGYYDATSQCFGAQKKYYYKLNVINPKYSPNSPPPENPIVQQSEMQQKINDYFNDPKTSQSKDLLIEQAEKPKGKASIMWSDDPSSEQTIYNDNKDTAQKVLESDNPVADGLTKDTPKISDGTSGSAESKTETNSDTTVNETTTQNPDGSTTTTGNHTTNNTTNNTFNFELPAFCNYATKLCDWLDWAKEEPELEGEKLDIEEQDITDYKYEDHVEWSSQCPFSEKTQILDFGSAMGELKFKYNLDFFCDFGHKAKKTIVGLGHLAALIFLIIGIRSGASG